MAPTPLVVTRATDCPDRGRSIRRRREGATAGTSPKKGKGAGQPPSQGWLAPATATGHQRGTGRGCGRPESEGAVRLHSGGMSGTAPSPASGRDTCIRHRPRDRHRWSRCEGGATSQRARPAATCTSRGGRGREGSRRPAWPAGTPRNMVAGAHPKCAWVRAPRARAHAHLHTLNVCRRAPMLRAGSHACCACTCCTQACPSVVPSTHIDVCGRAPLGKRMKSGKENSIEIKQETTHLCEIVGSKPYMIAEISQLHVQEIYQLEEMILDFLETVLAAIEKVYACCHKTMGLEQEQIKKIGYLLADGGDRGVERLQFSEKRSHPWRELTTRLVAYVGGKKISGRGANEGRCGLQLREQRESDEFFVRRSEEGRPNGEVWKDRLGGRLRDKGWLFGTPISSGTSGPKTATEPHSSEQLFDGVEDDENAILALILETLGWRYRTEHEQTAEHLLGHRYLSKLLTNDPETLGGKKYVIMEDKRLYSWQHSLEN
ncbi:hypothetical protein KSP40_PGU001155 [Platanthera guangdongensis]|uniref:Uncharacterized protein n=1 Tax=Platanthera guangdongensis TaxID=2320717 RepID=A0ABR2LKK0_9ASPA